MTKSEKAARAKRRQLRKERLKVSSEKRVVKVNIPVNLVEPVPTPKRMKGVVTQDNLLRMIYSDDPEDAKISLCNTHHDLLLEKLKLHRIDSFISKNEESLVKTIQSKGVDPLFHASESLIRLSLDTIGTEGVVQYRCPVCAFQKFDFVAQIAQLMKQACQRKSS